MIPVICAIIKDEHLYLKEWIDYHLSIGFSHIYLFEDYGSKSHITITKDYPNVTLSNLEQAGVPDDRNIPTHARRQYNLYSRQLQALKGKADWVAFIDIDEFIHFDNETSLSSLLSQHNNAPGIYLYWKMYDANNQLHFSPQPVQQRFTHVTNHWSHKEDAWMLKSIVNLHSNTFLDTIHHVHAGVNTLGIQTARVRCYHKAWINHYFTKSWEEWCWRFTRRGDVANNYRRIEEFFISNPNMIPQKQQLLNELLQK